MASNPDYSDFEKEGPDKVIDNLARDAYRPERAKLAMTWLDDLQRSDNARQAVLAWRVKAAKRAAVAVFFLVVLAVVFAAYLIFAGK